MHGSAATTFCATCSGTAGSLALWMDKIWWALLFIAVAVGVLVVDRLYMIAQRRKMCAMLDKLRARHKRKGES